MERMQNFQMVAGSKYAREAEQFGSESRNELWVLFP